MLHISVNTVKYHLKRAHAELQDKLSAYILLQILSFMLLFKTASFFELKNVRVRIIWFVVLNHNFHGFFGEKFGGLCCFLKHK